MGLQAFAVAPQDGLLPRTIPSGRTKRRAGNCYPVSQRHPAPFRRLTPHIAFQLHPIVALSSIRRLPCRPRRRAAVTRKSKKSSHAGAGPLFRRRKSVITRGYHTQLTEVGTIGRSGAERPCVGGRGASLGLIGRAFCGRFQRRPPAFPGRRRAARWISTASAIM
jgi:hypothetical protein